MQQTKLLKERVNKTEEKAREKNALPIIEEASEEAIMNIEEATKHEVTDGLSPIAKQVTSLSPPPSTEPFRSPAFAMLGISADLSTTCPFYTTPIALKYNDNYEHTIPEYHHERKSNEDDSTPYDGEMCRPTSKASKEVLNDEDILICPFGFIIPTQRSARVARERKEPEKDFVQQTLNVAERVQEADLGDVQAALRSKKAKISFEVKGVDGIVSHPSGFVPPTAVTDFYSQKRVPRASSTRHATASSSNPRHSETDPSGEPDRLAT